MTETELSARLREGRNVWAIAAVHGEVEQLALLHETMFERLAEGDQVIYLGNLLGHGPKVRETLDAALLFRRRVIAKPGAEASDVVFLRGAQEEIWQKLLQLQFATGPLQVLQWMAQHGVAATISAYGGRIEDGFHAIREGIVALTRWTSGLRQTMREIDGHGQYLSALKHAAFTGEDGLLFVHGGIDPARPLGAQSDSFWWGNAGFTRLESPYGGFKTVVRGFELKHEGPRQDTHTITLDAGCGFGGKLAAARFDSAGQLAELIEV
jgi:serine/threonine protein phosphatase 1